MSAFDALRAPVHAAEPDRRFVDRLRTDLVAALAPTVALPDRNPSTDPVPEPITAGAGTLSRLVPYLAVRGADAAIEWYSTVLEAREIIRYTGDDGSIGHAEIDIAGATLYLSDEYPDFDAISPSTLGGSTVALNLVVADVDAVFERAVARGAIVRREPADQPYGERSCTFLDPWGHRWMVQTTVSTPTIDEINATMDGFTVTAADATAGARIVREPRVDERPEVHLLGIRDEVAMADLGEVIPRLLDELMAWLAQHSVASRKPLVRYHAIDPERSSVDVTIGVVTDGRAHTGDERVVPEVLLAGRYASLVYAGLEGAAANAVLVRWAEANDVRWDRWDGDRGDTFATRVEHLLTGPDDDPDPAAWLTEVAIRIADTDTDQNTDQKTDQEP